MLAGLGRTGHGQFRISALVALAKSQLLRRDDFHGYDVVLNRIVDEFRILETVGIELEDGTTMHGALVLATGDNLGRRLICGFVESPGANYPCDKCLITRPEIQFKFDNFSMRTEQNYNLQLNEVCQTPAIISSSGIKRRTPLNELAYFHVTRNYASELMHDFNEGVGPYFVKVVLHHLILEDKLFTLASLNLKIAYFKLGRTDRKNKPSEIPDVTNPITAGTRTLKQKAQQFWCLFRLLPLMIANSVDIDNVHWQFYLQLRSIADQLFAQQWTEQQTHNFEQRAADLLRRFRELYPNYPLTPKAHNLLHYGLYARMCGPPYKSMVTAEEMKNGLIKKSAPISCNFMNIALTLAKKHQFAIYRSTKCNEIEKDRADVRKTERIALTSITADTSQIAAELQIEDGIAQLHTDVQLRGQRYVTGDVVIISMQPQLRAGTLIGFIGLLTPSHLFAVVRDLELSQWDVHRHCFVVRKLSSHSIHRFVELHDYHPLDLYAAESLNTFYLCPRYRL